MDAPDILVIEVESGDDPAGKVNQLAAEAVRGYDACLVGLDVRELDWSADKAVAWMRAFDSAIDAVAARSGRLYRGRYPTFVAVVPGGLPAADMARWRRTGMRVVVPSQLSADERPFARIANQLRDDWMEADRANGSDPERPARLAGR